MNSHVHGPAMFIADAPALDFLNSTATPVDEVVDWIGDGQGLMDWLRQAGWVSQESLHAIADAAMPGELDRVAAQARALRDWFRDFVARHQGKPLSTDALSDLSTLNHLLGRDDRFIQIGIADQDPSKLELQPRRRWKTPDSLLLPIGEVLASFICEEDFTVVKNCEGVSCTLMFVDHTRGKKRRWCSMAVCGNRAKAAAHRERKKATID